MRVYLDYAASTPLDEDVFQAMLPYLRDQFGNPSSVHSHGRNLRSAVEQARRTLADLLNCAPAELIFTSGGTEADNAAIKCNALDGNVQRIITSPLEHHAVLHAAETAAQAAGIPLEFIPVNEKGRHDLAALEQLLRDGPPALVSVMHINNELGNINPIEDIGALCAEYGALFHSDTVQSIGLYQLDLEALPMHFAAASAHKFNGPRGIGFLYAQAGHTTRPLICGGAQERNQRAGTEHVAGIVGMAAALQKTYQNIEAKRHHLTELKNYFWAKLQENFPAIELNGDPANAAPTVLNVAFPGSNPDGMLLMQLDINQISVSGGSACTSGSVKGSHVLQACGLQGDRLQSSIRFSFGPSNTKEELDYVLQKLKEIKIPAA